MTTPVNQEIQKPNQLTGMKLALLIVRVLI